MTQPGREWQSEDYRFGFQNQEQDKEFYDGAVSYKYRIHDPRIGRFLSIDPLAPSYPHNSPYAFSENRVIDAVELEGLEMVQVNYTYDAASNTISRQQTSSDAFQLNGEPVTSFNYTLTIIDEGEYSDGEKYSHTYTFTVEDEDEALLGIELYSFQKADPRGFSETYGWNLYMEEFEEEGFTPNGWIAWARRKRASYNFDKWVEGTAVPYLEQAAVGHATGGLAKTVGAAGLFGKKGKSKKPQKPVQKYEVGDFNDLQNRSVVGDGLDLHHVPQKHPAGQVIPGYDHRRAPAMAVPRPDHKDIPTQRGTYTGTPRDLLAKDAKDLRNAGVPTDKVQEIIDFNKRRYPNSYRKQ